MATERFAIADSIVVAELGTEGVLLDVKSGNYFGLDETGSTIWKLLGKGHTAAEICEQMVATYDVEPDQLRGDVTEFIMQLEASALIRRRPD